MNWKDLTTPRSYFNLTQIPKHVLRLLFLEFSFAKDKIRALFPKSVEKKVALSSSGYSVRREAKNQKKRNKDSKTQSVVKI